MKGAANLTRLARRWGKQEIMLALLTLILALPSQTSADDLRTAALTPGAEMLRQVDVPTVLPAADTARYQRIFALEERGAWAEADREIARLEDRLLLGHVLAVRYLSKTYRASYGELAAWLGHYADEPDAKEIYALALHRKPAHTPALARPAGVAPEPAQAELDDTPSPHAALVARQIRSLADTAPRRAEALLLGPEAKRLLDPDSRGELRIVVADALATIGKPEAAAPAPSEGAAQAHWDAGLAAWRDGKFTEARAEFEALARNPGHSPWAKSGAAFWAARVELRLRRPDHVSYWLGIAAEEPRTFYGLLARRILGIESELDFAAEPFTTLDARAVTSLEAGRRALGLVAVGQRARAAEELRALAQSDSPALLQSLAALADRADLPALSLQLAGTLAQTDGRYHDRALYPVPRWTPRGGFTVDRALIFALMRQESLFVPRVASASGAQGLMQLMPKTARDMAARKGLPLSERDSETERALADPELNLTLAQEYVRMLLRDQRVKGNLMLFALAYNRGPSALPSREERRGDPLLFLESIASPQARLFTKHVLTNYWIYRARLHQATPDLDALATGKWPTYIALDPRPVQDGRYAANR